MNRCEDCGGEFYIGKKIMRFTPGDGYLDPPDHYCPFCGSPDYYDVDEYNDDEDEE